MFLFWRYTPLFVLRQNQITRNNHVRSIRTLLWNLDSGDRQREKCIWCMKRRAFFEHLIIVQCWGNTEKWDHEEEKNDWPSLPTGTRPLASYFKAVRIQTGQDVNPSIVQQPTDVIIQPVTLDQVLLHVITVWWREKRDWFRKSSK